MSSDVLGGRFSIGDLIKAGVIFAHKDGNFGSLYPRIDDFVDEGIPLLTAKVVNDGRIDFSAAQKLSKEKAAKLPYGFIQAGDVLLSHNATVGRVAVVPEFKGEALIGTSLTYFRVNKERLMPRYLACFFESRDFQSQLAGIMGLSTRNQVPITAQRLLEIRVPPMAVQQKVSDFVGALDDRITLLRETNATLEAIAQALFKSWFVDFDPVRAKMEGRVPEGMDEATAALFPDSFEETEFGEVPRGWLLGKITDLGDVVCGKTPPTSCLENYGSDVPFITIPDMHGLLAVTTTARSLSLQGANSQAKKYLPIGSVCVSCIATPGLVVLVTKPSQTNQQINSVIPFTGWGKAFPLFLLRRVGGAVRMGGSGGSVFHNLSKSNFETIDALLPTQALAQAFNYYVEPLVSRIVENQRLAEILSNIRDGLLPKLISGQLQLRDVCEVGDA